jgi:hypothetical protein
MKCEAQKRLENQLAKRHVCYVLITCDAPAEDGHMQVRMTYEGDASLAACLLQGAQSFIHDKEFLPQFE